MQSASLDSLFTPALLLDRARMLANIERMRAQAARFPHVRLRPHLKTNKCIPVARMVAGEDDPITVSTLQEAERFHQAGYRDILYAVGIAPAKLPRVAALIRAGAQMTIILDSLATAEAVAEFAGREELAVPTLIEIDTDGHRGGLSPDDPLIVEIGRRLGPNLVGVLTHAGGSYDARTHEEIRRYARMERDGIVAAATMLRDAGLTCKIVSMGSTPTALFAESLDGVTELRAGVYVFQDLVMAGVSACTVDEIAISVLTSVIGHKPERGWLLVDAGWMAMSRDRGTQNQAMDMGFGLVCDRYGTPIGDLVISSANQEHGIITSRSGQPIDPDRFPIGTRLRILPNHACATAAQFPAYNVIADGLVVARWERFSHW
ncbi:alanine racemase [Novosphingobium sp. PC22D]|uniref:alanine racemase n=1 Tax=Novosphingobium sp. PC22D TaxID=1962403 RepID=UPI000BF1F7F3|nr:alanine racemase [Novosphingobium sp. PC22D]PEQ11940.1 alanine racemase [Novosphingobium sp. PC22D]